MTIVYQHVIHHTIMSFSNSSNAQLQHYISPTSPIGRHGVRKSLKELFDAAATPTCPPTPFMTRVKSAWNQDGAQVSTKLNDKFESA